jgi:Na+-translocating ferredoxin:NAD+ oxidoreductase subunit C
MNTVQRFTMKGGLALSRPAQSTIDNNIHTQPLQSTYYLPTLNYSRAVLHSDCKPGQHVLRGEPLADGIIAPTSGTLREQVEHEWPHPSQLPVPTWVLDADGLDTAFTLPPLPEHAGADEKLLRVAAAGVQGLGGAGFSTAKKIERVCEHAKRTLVINAVECEPGVECDRVLMQSNPSAVINACKALVDWIKPEQTLFAIEDDKHEAINALTGENSHQQDPFLTWITLPAVYPSGAESLLVQRLTGLHLAPNQRAADVGILCINVSTVMAIYNALHGEAAVDRLVSVSTQDLMHTTTLRARFGTPLRSVVEFAASTHTGLAEALRLNDMTVQVGGPLSGFSWPMNNAPILAGCNALLIGPAHQAQQPSACIRCAECANVCPANLLPQELYTAAKSNDHDVLKQYRLDACVLCGCCDVVCPADIPLTQWFRFAKGSVAERARNEADAALAKTRSEKRAARVKERAKQKAIADEQRRAAATASKQSIADIQAALARVKRKKPST